MPGLVPGAGASILQCRGMPDWNAVLCESGGTGANGRDGAPHHHTRRTIAILPNRLSRLRLS